MKYTPQSIKKLNENEIFCFGSNERGAHSAGAALTALHCFGAIYGQGDGLQGRSYAIATKDRRIQTLPLFAIAENVNRFIAFAKDNPDLTFYVTLIGCGLAGYTPDQIAPLFKQPLTDNIILPIEFHGN